MFLLANIHLHYCSTKWAVADMFWLDPAYRFGWTGYKMLKAVEPRMRELGVKVVMIPFKLHFEAERGTLAKLLARLGYKPTEATFSKYIG